MLVDEDKLISFCTFAPKDDIQPTDLFPWIGFLYTFPEYRGHRYAQILLAYAESLATVIVHLSHYLFIFAFFKIVFSRIFWMSKFFYRPFDNIIFKKNDSSNQRRAAPAVQTQVKIFCFKSLNYYLKMHKMVEFFSGGIMLLREILAEINVILTMDKLKTGNITSARTCRGWKIKMSDHDLRLLP